MANCAKCDTNRPQGDQQMQHDTVEYVETALVSWDQHRVLSVAL